MEQRAAVAAHHLFGLVDDRHYEPLSRRAITPQYRDALQRLLPDAWALERSDVWLHARMVAGTTGMRGVRGVADSSRRTAPPPAQGFKIHVSSAPAHALRLFDLVVPVCVDNGVEFKTAADPVLLGVINSKTQERGFSGKFMTIYPPDEDVFVELIETLYRRTVDEPVDGPYVLSDRRYRDSRVLFYRYGGFRPPRRLNIDGTHSTFLVSPDGTYVADERLPYFRLPPWVRDPFAEEPAEEPAEDSAARPAGEPAATLRDGRYRIEGALTFSNAGGVYHGTDRVTRTPVVVKEARRLTNCWTSGNRTVDSVDMLRHEYEVLRRLEGLEFVPRPVDLFQEWEHTFLVEERVDGIAFHDFWARDDVILAPYIRREGRVARFVPRFREVVGRLIHMVDEVHARGVVLGDLSPNNVLIDPETLRMWFIDFESAVHEDDEAALLAYGTRWGTPGFLHPDRASRDRLLPCDDWYAAAMLLYSSVVPATAFFALNPLAQDLILDELVALGVPDRVRSVVSCLAAGRVDEAKSVLADWEDG
ncbi:class III lanthionine synthetase LanKC N-terminal domain-containing protein [Streptomyces sp. NBC_01439]|uniref:class III lanthionine synthetase LanKC N-terminal domain-containing protein n=1 Tax=Streptomyces sp. NBC_01439 TaxID=2903867 RepID=UPI002E2B9794|nr:RIO1 family regulatory kinase/ATPase [Streptomyces sp. NBC_01439]